MPRRAEAEHAALTDFGRQTTSRPRTADKRHCFTLLEIEQRQGFPCRRCHVCDERLHLLIMHWPVPCRRTVYADMQMCL